MKKPKINAIISGAIIAKASGGDFTEGAFRAMVVWLYNDWFDDMMTAIQHGASPMNYVDPATAIPKHVIQKSIEEHKKEFEALKKDIKNEIPKIKRGLAQGLRNYSKTAGVASLYTGQPELVVWFYISGYAADIAANSLDDNPNIGVYRNFGVDIITSPIEKSNPVGRAVTNYLIKSYLDYNSK